MSQYQLHFQITSYWHCGSGRGGGLMVDAVAHKDPHDLPEIPGRTIKGLVRDAVQRTEDLGHLEPGATKRWFGTDTRDFSADPSTNRRDTSQRQFARHQSQPGLLIFDNAVLPHALSGWLRGQPPAVRAQFYRHIHATALDEAKGAAKAQSLRGIEVVIPLDLYAPVQLQSANAVDHDLNSWPDQIRKCLHLIRGLGLSRNRGLGRCWVTLEEVSS